MPIGYTFSLFIANICHDSSLNMKDVVEIQHTSNTTVPDLTDLRELIALDKPTLPKRSYKKRNYFMFH